MHCKAWQNINLSTNLSALWCIACVSKSCFMNIILEMINKFWKFDDNQQPISNLHDKQDLLKAIEHEFQFNKTCSKCVSLCKNTKSKYKHDKFYCLDTGSFIANKDEHSCEAFQHVC